MLGSFRVARILGIDIYIDWSWLFIFALVTWNLAVAVFPTVHPEWSLWLTVGVSLAASFLFFASVLAHELAHSVVARARGLPVQRITLFIFGGAADIGREPPSPKSEFLIAVVGPIMSIALGVLFTGIGLLLINGGGLFGENAFNTLTTLSPVATLMLWLGPINFLLGIFNMVPGFPLDGGRILRSIVWGISGNMVLSTRVATFAGQLVAWLFIFTGIAMVFGISVPIFGSGLIGGLWLVFIGWFLNNAAVNSYRHAVVTHMLEGIQVSRLMRQDTPAVEPYLPLSTLVYDYVIGTEENTFPVLESGELRGMVTLEDVRKVPREQWDTKMVKDVMTAMDTLDVVGPGQDINDALDKLTRKELRQIPVIDNNQLVGVLRRKDIVRWLQTQSNVSAGD
jgi:Zn-dependent protease/CBS domain-containing protein